ncbi:hypothetical protein [Sphaerisporangium fuscum]|uniref:hypothetical protein n=1 Tax=Sphaerisporangium fuscum TaxID=2835868 RepID=UPI001BDC3390|nr:hypothetical protein [Sphaerisporangium fuscum]
MNRDWRTGSIELVTGYTLTDADGRRARRVDDVRFAIEGGFVNVRVPGVAHVQIVSAPAVGLITASS